MSAEPGFEAKTRLLLADDHVLVAQGIERLLMECFPSIETVRSGDDVVRPCSAATWTSSSATSAWTA